VVTGADARRPPATLVTLIIGGLPTYSPMASSGCCTPRTCALSQFWARSASKGCPGLALFNGRHLHDRDDASAGERPGWVPWFSFLSVRVGSLLVEKIQNENWSGARLAAHELRYGEIELRSEGWQRQHWLAAGGGLALAMGGRSGAHPASEMSMLCLEGYSCCIGVNRRAGRRAGWSGSSWSGVGEGKRSTA